MDLVDSIYAVTRTFPKSEMFGMMAQMRSAASSVPANIAEGRGRGSFRDYRAFLRRARGSLMELETHIETSRRQKYVTDEAAERLFSQSLRVAQLLNGVIRHTTELIRAGDRRPATGDRRPTAPAR